MGYTHNHDKTYAPLVGSNQQPTHITNAGFGVWSNGTIESAVSSINLVSNGDFETDIAGWTAGNSAALARDTSTFIYGTACLKITNSGATQGYSSTPITTVVGRVYKVACWVKCGTATSVILGAGTASSDITLGNIASAATSFTRLEVSFEAIGTTTYILLLNNTVSGGTGYFDSVSVYDMGVNLALNGTFNSATTSWGVNGGTLASVAGGLNGNCLQVTNGTNSYASASQSIAVTPGKLYRIGVWIKAGTSSGTLVAGSSGLAYNYGYVIEATATWQYKTLLVEAKTSALDIYPMNSSTVTGQTAFYDSITVTEVTVGLINLDYYGCDTWNKAYAGKIWRETISTKDGSYYALRVYNGDASWLCSARYNLVDYIANYKNRNVVVGCWVKSSTPNKARLQISDNATIFYSPYHTGSGSWEWLECTGKAASSATMFSVAFNSGTSAEAFFSQPQFQYGTSIGEGNFVPQQNEVINLETSVPSSRFPGTAERYSSGVITFFLGADSQGKIPRNAKQIGTDFAALDSAIGYYGGSINTADAGIINPTNNQWTHAYGTIQNKTNGIMTANLSASGTNTLGFLMAYKYVVLY